MFATNSFVVVKYWQVSLKTHLPFSYVYVALNPAPLMSSFVINRTSSILAELVITGGGILPQNLAL